MMWTGICKKKKNSFKAFDIFKQNKIFSFIYILNLLLFIIMTFIISISGCNKNKQQHISKGRKYLKERKYNAAIIEFKNAVNIDPNDYLVRLYLAESYFQTDKLYNAEKELKQVIGKKSGISQAHFLLASTR